MPTPDEIRDAIRELERRLAEAPPEQKEKIRERIKQLRDRLSQARPEGGGPTLEQKTKEKAREDAQKAKARSLKDAKQRYINLIISLDLNPSDYRDVIERAAKNSWGTDTFLKRAGLESIAAAAKEQESFLNSILADYEEVHGKPADQGTIASLQGMSADQLAAYGADLRQRLNAKAKDQASKDTYLDQLRSSYFNLWGKMPPSGYVEAAAEQGLDIFAFEWQERHRPEFEHTQGYQQAGMSLASEVSRILGLG